MPLAVPVQNGLAGKKDAKVGARRDERGRAWRGTEAARRTPSACRLVSPFCKTGKRCRACRYRWIVAVIACERSRLAGGCAPIVAWPASTRVDGTACSPQNQASSANRGLCCGQAPVYPQDPMCRNGLFADRPFFLHHRCRCDTGLVQPVQHALRR